jgi:hypothetical protein
MASFSWAMSMFGVEQMTNLMAPSRAAQAFESVARSAQGELGRTLRSAFQTGDRLQRAVVDLSFSLVGLDTSGALNQAGNLAFELFQLGTTTVYSVTGVAWQQQKGLPGWGPIPPPLETPPPPTGCLL